MTNIKFATFFEESANRLSNHPQCNLTKEEILAILLNEDNDDNCTQNTQETTRKVKPKISTGNSNSGIASSGKYDEDNLKKMKVAELKEICAEIGVSKTGTKAVLIQKIIGSSSNKPVISKITNFLTKTIEVISSPAGTGNCIMPETGFVFNKNIDVVEGKEVEINGKTSVVELTEKDIELVKKYGLQYAYPSNLNTANDDAEEDEPEVLDVDIEDEEEDEDEDDEDFEIDDN